MATFGRKPAGDDRGVGHLPAGRARGAIMGRVPSNGWIYEFGGRVGKVPGGTDARYYHAVYETSGNTITDLVGGSVQGRASAPMDWGGNGANQAVRPTAPIMVYTTPTYALVTRVSSGDFAHGQDHSGHLMHDRTSGAGSSFPSPLGANHVRPEGMPSFWFEYQPNRRPDRPSNLSPANQDTIIDTTPTLGADFRDPDESLPGFAVGHADTVGKYRFEVWNAGKTSRVRDSGILASTAAQRAARRVTWSVPTALGAARYIARCTVWDQFGVASRVAEWTFTINTGGTFTGVDLDASNIIPGSRTTNGAGGNELLPGGTWQHAGGLHLATARIVIQTADGQNVRGPDNWNTSRAPGEVFAIYPYQLGWDNLPRGRHYRIGLAGWDTEGGWTQWTYGPSFTVNAAPNRPTDLRPVGTAHSSRPELSAVFTDANDRPETLTADFAVRPAGSAGNGTTVPASRFAGGRWYGTAPADVMSTYGEWEFRARATDRWGLTSGWSPWQSFIYAPRPTVTITEPSGGAHVDTGTPTFSFEVDRASTRFRLTIRHRTTRRVEFASPWHAMEGTRRSTVMPAGHLRNDTPYEAEIQVQDIYGLIGTAHVLFRVMYPAPPALANVTAEVIPGPFEPVADPSQWSRVQLTWPEAPLANAPESEWAGYLVRREHLGTGQSVIIGHNPAREDTIFVDKTGASGAQYRYSVSYLLLKNTLSLIESGPVAVEAGVTLTNTVLASLDADDIGVPLRYWEFRDATHQRQQDIIPTWGERPVAFMAPTRYLELEGEFQVIDDPHGGYTARDIVADVIELASPMREGTTVRPRLVCYRDPKGRVIPAVLSNVIEQDQHMNSRALVGLTVTEVNARLDIDEVDL